MIHRLAIPYKDIYTTVYTVHTDDGVLLLDTGASEEDVINHILPFLRDMGVTEHTLKYIVISHNHRDHAPGLPRIVQEFPAACIIAADTELRSRYPHTVAPQDGDCVLGVLQLWNTPGHDADCCSVLDTRTGTLLTGDALQMYGIVSGFPLGAHLRTPSAYLTTLDTVAALPVKTILTAHDYQPCGYRIDGEDAIREMLDLCRLPFERLRTILTEHPTADCDTIRLLYTKAEFLPIGDRAIEAMREWINHK